MTDQHYSLRLQRSMNRVSASVDGARDRCRLDVDGGPGRSAGEELTRTELRLFAVACLAMLDGKRVIEELHRTAEEQHGAADPAARIAELERDLKLSREAHEAALADREHLRQKWEQRGARDRIERDEARARATELKRERDALSQTLDTERAAAVAPGDDLERARKELADLRETYDAEMDYRDWKCRELGAHAGEAFDTFLRRVCAELSDLRNRYRSRMHGEEPAPLGRRVLFYDESSRYWRPGSGTTLDAECYWMHQPPAPDRGK